MQALEFEGMLVGVIALDFCFPCQVIWFDSHESTKLSPGGILEVFKAFDARKAATRNTLPSLLDCPRCGSRLEVTQDVQHSTRFTYYRCSWGHGRLTPFLQFLREKNFIRPLTVAELADLKSKIRTIQCSNCGAPIDLARDTACPYCRSPIAILDTEAVSKTLRELADAQARRSTIDFDVLADALLMRPSPREDRAPHFASVPDLGGNLGMDLVAAGIAVVAAFLR
jgi:DNA-directed RNA polymerase subunit RPC12/RpoP